MPHTKVQFFLNKLHFNTSHILHINIYKRMHMILSKTEGIECKTVRFRTNHLVNELSVEAKKFYYVNHRSANILQNNLPSIGNRHLNLDKNAHKFIKLCLRIL